MSIVAKPAVTKLSKGEGVYPGQRDALAVADWCAVHIDLMAIVDIADGRESSFSDVMRDPVDIGEGADTRISFDCPPQSRKLCAHAEGFCYR